jgi:hypothetical protein
MTSDRINEIVKEVFGPELYARIQNQLIIKEKEQIMKEMKDMARMCLDIINDPLDWNTMRDKVYTGLSMKEVEKEKKGNIWRAKKVAIKIVKMLENPDSNFKNYNDWKNYRDEIMLEQLIGFEGIYRGYFDDAF